MKITTLVSLLKVGWNEKGIFSNKPDVMNRFVMVIPALVIILGVILLIMPDLTDLIGCNWYVFIEYAIAMFSINVCSLALGYKQENANDVLLIERVDKIHLLFAKTFWLSLIIMIINLVLWIVFSLILKIY